MHSIRNILKAVRNFLFSGLNKEFLIFLFFLALSGAFWLMMTLNETMEREYKIPMRLVGTPRNAVITGDLPDTVRITVRDKGFTLITYAFRPLNFKFNNYADETEGQGMIPVADVQKQILSQLYGSSKLLQVKPGKFDFYFTYGASKKVPVVFRGKITTSKSYYLAHTEFFPSTVTVYANKRQLDEVKAVEIVPFYYRNLQDTIRENVRIKKIRGVKVMPDMVRLAVYPDIANSRCSGSIGMRNWSCASSYPAGTRGSDSIVVTVKFTKYSVPTLGLSPFIFTLSSLLVCGSISIVTLLRRMTLSFSFTS